VAVHLAMAWARAGLGGLAHRRNRAALLALADPWDLAAPRDLTASSDQADLASCRDRVALRDLTVSAVPVGPLAPLAPLAQTPTVPN
jgi:hypothetical protein